MILFKEIREKYSNSAEVMAAMENIDDNGIITINGKNTYCLRNT